MRPMRAPPLSLTIQAFAAVAVGLWLALAIAGGVAAAAIFPAARSLELSLAGYEAFLAAEPELGRTLVAGYLAERVFDLTGPLRTGLALAAAALVVAALPWRALRPVHIAAALALAIALTGLFVGRFVSERDFRSEDAAYRALAKAGQIDAARAKKPSVDAAHDSASRLASTEALALLALVALLGAGRAWSGTVDRAAKDASPRG